MADIVKPDMSRLWANSGTQTQPADAIVDSGWQSGDIPPSQSFNYIDGRQDKAIAYMLQKGIPEWDSATEYQANKSWVQYGGKVYYCTQTSVNKQPDLFTSYWSDYFVQKQELEAPTGAGEVGFDDTLSTSSYNNVQQALAKAERGSYLKQGLAITPTYVMDSQFNSSHSDSAACGVAGGTSQQPNKLGWNVKKGTFTTDGVTAAFVLACGFTVTLNPDREIVRVALLRKSDGVRFPQVAGTDYTVSGSGSSTITVTFNTAPTTDYTVWIRAIGDAQSAYAPLLNFATHGYDSVTDGQGPMTVVLGAHHSEYGNNSGHNSFLGGSYNEIFGGSSYSVVGGHENHLDGVAFGFVLGGRNNLSASSGAAVFGQNNNVDNATGALVGGYDHAFSAKPYTVVGGRGAVPLASGSITVGNKKSGDTSAGLRQFHLIGLSKTTTDATEGFLSANNGTSLTVLNPSSACKISVECIATSSDGANVKSFNLDFIVKRIGGATTLIGTATATSPANSGSATDTWSLRAQTVSNGFYIRPTGAAGVTIRWMATVTVTETSFNAP